MHERVQMIIDRARRSGSSIPTRLNDAQLLWTPRRQHQLTVEVLENLMMEFKVWLPHEFLRTVSRSLASCTPTDMHSAIETWLQSYIDHIKRSM